MRHIIFGLGSTLLIILILTATLSIEGANVRNREVKNALHAALENAIYSSFSKEGYDIKNNDLLVADVTALLLEQLNSNDENLSLSVDIAKVDAKRGLLSMRVTEEYTFPNGKIGKVQDEATIVLEKEISKNRHNIVYRLPKSFAKTIGIPANIRSYCIEEKQKCKVPDDPTILREKGYQIQGWVDKSDNKEYSNKQLESLPATKDMILVANIE